MELEFEISRGLTPLTATGLEDRLLRWVQGAPFGPPRGPFFGTFWLPLGSLGGPPGPLGAAFGATWGTRVNFSRFFVDFRVPEGAPKFPLSPPGAPKRPPGTLRTPLLGAGREHGGNRPDTPKAKCAPGHLWSRFGSICLRFGSLREPLWEPFWRHFRTSVQKGRPS